MKLIIIGRNGFNLDFLVRWERVDKSLILYFEDGTTRVYNKDIAQRIVGVLENHCVAVIRA